MIEPIVLAEYIREIQKAGNPISNAKIQNVKGMPKPLTENLRFEL
jgi:hypothetical protein